MTDLEKLEQDFNTWTTKVEKANEKYPERKKQFVTGSNAPVKRVYTPLDQKDFDYEKKLGLPGEFPYTRGVQPTMYRGRLWTMRQYAGFGTAEESNARYKYLLEQGQTGLSVAFDLPTQIGYDSDHPLSRGRGRQGWRGHRFARGHGNAVRRHPARQGVHEHDDQRARGGAPCDVYRGC